MRKTTLLLLSAMLLVLGSAGRPATHPTQRLDVSAPGSALACTSFAVYSDETLYGMNFDYPDVEIRFTINTAGDLRVFQMEFEQDDGWSPTVGMNSAGLFASCQMLFPEVEGSAETSENEVFTWEVYRRALYDFVTVEDVEQYLNDRRVVHWSVTLHDLIADPHGDAMVVEPGETANVITRIDGDFIVMANFPNGEFVSQSYEDVSGVGADRYKAAYRHILDHLREFGRTEALEALERAVQLSGGYSTLCSMVFDPARNEVLIALRRDFDRIWKVSLEDGTIETHRGSGRSWKAQLGPAGVTATKMLANAERVPLHWGYIVGPLVVLAAVVVILAARSRRGRRDAGTGTE
jgi:hypothetical protein